MTSEEKVKLDIFIVRLKHEITDIISKLPTSFTRDKDYIEKKKLLDTKLELQMKHDLVNYKRNLIKFPEEINLSEFKNIDKYKNLSIEEKNLLSKYNYDYRTDSLKLFTQYPNDSLLTKEWKELRKKKNLQSTREFYNDRDWNS
jgi:hypothetical protein